MHVWIEGKWGKKGGESMVRAGEMAGKLVGRSKSGAILKLRTLCPLSLLSIYTADLEPVALFICQEYYMKRLIRTKVN